MNDKSNLGLLLMLIIKVLHLVPEGFVFMLGLLTFFN
jgi:hypothetical protein